MRSRKWKAEAGNVKGRKSRAAQRKRKGLCSTFNATENHVHCMNGDISETAQDRLGQKQEKFSSGRHAKSELHHRGHGDQASSVNIHLWIGCIVSQSQLSRAENFGKTHPRG